MKVPTMNILRVWDPKTGKIKIHWFLKDQIVVGSDPSADLRLKSLPGFFARIDFVDSTVNFFGHDKSQPLESRRILQIGDYALQWQKMSFVPSDRRFLKMGGLVAMGVIILTMSVSGFQKSELCGERDRLFASGDWAARRLIHLAEGERSVFTEARNIRQEISKAIAEGSFIKARAALTDLSKLIQAQSPTEGCGTENQVLKLETQFARALIKNYLKSGDLLKASQEFSRLKSLGVAQGTESIERRLRKAARDLYLEGYREEDENPDEAYEKMEEARGVCRLLAGGADCLKIQNPSFSRSEGRDPIPSEP